jgi:hypothetical protein
MPDSVLANGTTAAAIFRRLSGYGIVFVARQKHADAPHAVALLPARRERPSSLRLLRPR